MCGATRDVRFGPIADIRSLRRVGRLDVVNCDDFDFSVITHCRAGEITANIHDNANDSQPSGSLNRASSKMDQTSGSNAIDVPAISIGGLVQRGAHGPLRRFLRAFIHFFSYHLVLSSSIRTIRAARFHLRVRPTVFHPSFFLSSEYFAEYLDGLDLSGKSVADIGTGSGILALAAARAGATKVLALDINPNAALSTLENARAHGLGDRVTVACMNLLAALPPLPLFDVILSSLPKHAGEPRDLADRGWHAGPHYRDVAALFEQA